MRVDDLLHPNEEVLMFLRRDKWVLIKVVATYTTLMAVPIIIYILLSFFAPLWLNTKFQEALPTVLMLLGGSIYYLYVWVFFFRSWLDYYLDVWFVTTERVVSIDQRGLFSRTIAEQRLFRIQDVHAEVHGVIPTLLDFGDVTIQTAAAEIVFIFKEVPKPHQIARNITRLVEWDKKNHQITE